VGTRVGVPEKFEATHRLLPTSYVHLALFYVTEYPSIMIISRLATIRTSEVGATRASRRSNQNLPDRSSMLEKEVKKQGCPGEVHQGGEGPHWTVVPSKKKKKKKKA